jgi:hypothetical protein
MSSSPPETATTPGTIPPPSTTPGSSVDEGAEDAPNAINTSAHGSSNSTVPAMPSAGSADTATSGTAIASAPTSIQKAIQAGLNKESFEQEVGQVLGTLNSWWGGVKKQVV